jgi:hypothetical protein
LKENILERRIFVSSVVNGFGKYRQSAREGIVGADCEPVMVEDFPALSKSPRNACLDGVQSSDAVVVIIGGRGGWKAPSGKLVVEEEIEEAGKRGLPILLFVEELEHDNEAKRLLAKLEHYVDGAFRKNFSTSDELSDLVRETLVKTSGDSMKENDYSLVAKQFDDPFKIYQGTTLRFVHMPLRADEIITPFELGEDKLFAVLCELAHRQDVNLFSYKIAKEKEVQVSNVVILQNSGNNLNNLGETVRLQVGTNGLIIIDISVSVHPDEISSSFLRSMVVLERDMKEILNRCFSFVNAFYNEQDQFKRHNHFFYNVALINKEHRKIVKELPQGNSISMDIHEPAIVHAYDDPRQISRRDMHEPLKEIQTVVSLMSRRCNST